MSKVIRARYEKGIFKPLEPIELEEGEEVVISIERDIHTLIRKYRGALGKASIKEILQLEEEAQAQ